MVEKQHAFNRNDTLNFCFLFFVVLGTELRTLCMVGKCSTVELNPPPQISVFLEIAVGHSVLGSDSDLYLLVSHTVRRVDSGYFISVLCWYARCSLG